MEMKNVFLVLLSLILAVSLTGSVMGSTEISDASRNVQITYEVGDSYYIVVPSAIKINEVASITVTNAVLSHDGYLNLSINGGLYYSLNDNHRAMKHVNVNENSYLKYDIFCEDHAEGATISENNAIKLAIDQEITIVDNDDTNLDTLVTHIQPKICDGVNIPTSGSYSDTVVFYIRVGSPSNIVTP